jgi:hypothetical protein
MKAGQLLFNSILPPVAKLSRTESDILKEMYPEINWVNVICFEGLPWYMKLSNAIGTALPDSYNRKRVNIYFKKYKDTPVKQRLLLLVHESFHILQYHELGSMNRNNKGIGFNRKFIHYYFGWYFQGLYHSFFKEKMTWSSSKSKAYRQHPMEVPAYNQEAEFEKKISTFYSDESKKYSGRYPELICTDSQLPDSPSFIFHFSGGLLALFISIIKPVIELIIIVVALILGGRLNK